jgi:hypothetical protein
MRTAIALLYLIIPVAALGEATPSPHTAEYCGDCHRAIYDGWKQSAHATAMESRLFQDALKMAESEFGSETRKVCLRCHSPAGVLLGDFSLIRKVSWEGVTCDYCHSIREVSTSGSNPVARVEFSNVKSGPSKNVVSPAHATVFSNVHTSSLVCISCHEYRNALGFAVLTTYSEWKDSPSAKEGQQCQSCHMFKVQGDIVDPGVKRSSEKGINLHQMPGGHSVEQLNKAMKAQLLTAREAGQLKVTVKLTNAGAGHYVPTGSPMRKMILEVLVEPEGGIPASRQEITYARSISDQKGEILQREHSAFLKGARVVKDTRFAPRETRAQELLFNVPPDKHLKVVANLYYYYSPMATAESQQEIKFLSLSRFIQ